MVFERFWGRTGFDVLFVAVGACQVCMELVKTIHKPIRADSNAAGNVVTDAFANLGANFVPGIAGLATGGAAVPAFA